MYIFRIIIYKENNKLATDKLNFKIISKCKIILCTDSTQSYNSSENPDFPIPSCWVPKSLSYIDFISSIRSLHSFQKKWLLAKPRILLKKFTNLEEKKSLISKYDSPQVYEFYNSIKDMNTPSCITYFSNTDQNEKSEFFTFNMIIWQNQQHKKEIELSNNVQKSSPEILKSTGTLPPKKFQKTCLIDWLVFYD